MSLLSLIFSPPERPLLAGKQNMYLSITPKQFITSHAPTYPSKKRLPMGVTKQRNSETGIFLFPDFLFSETRKNSPDFFFQLTKQSIWTSGFCIYNRVFISYKLRITMSITKKSGLPGPGYRRILSLRDSVETISSLFKYSLMGKMLKRRKAKRRNERTERN